MIKFHHKCFIESIPFEEVNPDQIRNRNNKFRNLHNIENKLTRFQLYPETELACKYKKNLQNTIFRKSCRIRTRFRHEYRTSNCRPYGHISFTYVSVNFQKNIGRIGGKLKPQDAESTRLHELSLMNRTYFGAIHYDIHLDMKLDYTISRIFQEMSLSEIETLDFTVTSTSSSQNTICRIFVIRK